MSEEYRNTEYQNNEGIRLNKWIADSGYCSRREADRLIEEKKVMLDGRVGTLGDRVMPGMKVTVNGKVLGRHTHKVYIALNKPEGIVCTADPREPMNVVEYVGHNERIFPIGRLDKDSSGLLLMTNDGDFSNAVMHPTHHVPKLYRVTLRSPMSEEQKLKFEEGIVLDGRRTAPALVNIVSSAADRCVVEITLYEGRNRQIRRMCEALGLEVARLRRNAVGKVKLGMLPVGNWRYLTPDEVKNLVMATGVTKKIAAGYIKYGREPDRDYHTARR